MDIEKICNNCTYSSLSVEKEPCNSCYSSDYLKWQPKEELVKQYVERCLPGEAAYDIINKPKHYMLFEDKGIEVRDVLAKLSSKLRLGECTTVPCNWDDGLFASDYVQLMQYLMRFMDKNGVEDLKKARFYLDKLIEAY